MALDGWFPGWFEAAYFPSVWFAPGDESQVPEDELREEYHGHGKRRPGRSRRQADYRSQFQDATEADIRALVEAKWDAIETAKSIPPAEPVLDKVLDKAVDKPAIPSAAEPAMLTSTDHFRDATKMIQEVKRAQEAQRKTNDDAFLIALLELV